MFKKLFIFLWMLCTCSIYAVTSEFQLPSSWELLQPILIARVNQAKPKMRLMPHQANSFVNFLAKLNSSTPNLTKLQDALPKTTLELLRAVHERNVSLNEAEKIAAYLQDALAKWQLENPKLFDENTSHIIGRDWSEIDYTGEGMTWEKQREKYRAHGITNFKTLENVQKFFPVESRLSYFKKIYRPKNPLALSGACVTG